MRIVLQRVSEASVRIDGSIFGQIGHGMLVLLGIEELDEKDEEFYGCKQHYSLFFESMTIVTGPSLTSETFMSAANCPVSTERQDLPANSKIK